LTRVLQAVRTGTSVLEWGQFPSHVGSRFAATFRSSRRIAATAPFTVTLRCVNQRWVNRGDSSTKNSYEVYSEAVEVRPHDDPRGGTVLHLDFAVPPGAQGTHLAQLNPVFWQLVVTGPTAGPDFSATFLVPIYAPGGPPRETASEERVVVTTRWVRGRRVVTVDDANTSRFPLYFGVAVFGLVGLGLVWFATSTAIDTIRFLNTAETVEGTVLREETSWSRSSDGKQSKSVAAVIGYRVGGREYTVSQQITSGSSTYAVGEHVRVLYRPSRPDEARIDATLELFFLPILLGFMGLMCVGASGAIWGVFIKR
jgi:hypothetical protein